MSKIIAQKKVFKLKAWYILVFALALIIRIVVAVPLVHDWDGFVFSESAKNMLHGITPYETVEQNEPFIYPNSDRPMLQQWYAYPPLPVLMFTAPYFVTQLVGLVINPNFENIIFKIPFIFGDLLFAFLLFLFLFKKNLRMAEHGMLLILFNPLLIWVSSVWGMFDIWTLNFLLLFLLFVRTESFILAGFFLALAPEIKLFAVFFLPAIFVYVLQINKNIFERIKFFVSFTVTTVAFVLPFLLLNPQGFLNQTLLMHLHRTPQGIGIVGIFDYLSHVYNFDVSYLSTIGGLLMLFTIVIFNIFSITYIKGSMHRLLIIILLIYTAVLVFNKVVNEQYFVVFIGLLILINHLPRTEPLMFSWKFLQSVKSVATFTVLFAGIVLGFHFLTFLPSFLSEGYLKESTNSLVFYLSKLVPNIPLYTYPNSISTFYNLPVFITYIVLIPLIGMSFYMVTKGLLSVILSRKEVLSDIMHLASSFGKSFTVRKIIIGVFVLLCIVPPSIFLNNYLKENNAYTLIDLVDKKTYELPANPKIGTFYYTWWNNASLRDDIAGDTWDKVTTNPADGYYTSKNSYFVKHIKQMKEVGIDFAIVSYHIYDRDRYLTFAEYANKLGLYYAPLIETVDVLGIEKYRPVGPDGEKFLGFSLSDEALSELETIVISSVQDSKINPATFKIENKTVIFIYDGHWFYPSWDDKTKKLLAHRVFEKYEDGKENPFNAISDSWGTSIISEDDMLNYYPKDVTAFNNQEQSAVDYREAFLLEYKIFWTKLRTNIEDKIGPVYLLSTYTPPTQNMNDFVIQAEDILKSGAFDNDFFYSLSNTWVNWKYIVNSEKIMKIWSKQLEDQANRNRNYNVPAILTVTPTYKDTVIRGELGFEIPAKINGRSVYDWTWKIAMENNPDYVLIATWNEFFEGTAIEPTKEYSDFYLKETKRLVDEYKK